MNYGLKPKRKIQEVFLGVYWPSWALNNYPTEKPPEVYMIWYEDGTTKQIMKF